MRISAFVVLLSLYGLAQSAIYLPSGVPYTATIKSGQSLMFWYNLTIGCRDLKIFSTGDNDLYISQTDPNPGVYGYSMMSDACGGDEVYIKHTADKHPEGVYWISAYLDPIIYDGSTNVTIELLELISANTLLPNSSLTYSDTDAGPHPICINKFAPQIEIEVTATAPFGVFLAKHNHPVTTWNDNVQQKLIFTSGNATEASFVVSADLYPGFERGNWFITVYPDCGCNCTAPLDYSLVVRPYTNSVSSNTPTDTITALTSGVSKSASLATPTYYSFDVGYCDDVTITLANTTKAEMYVAYTKYPTANDFAWRASCTEQIFVSHEDLSYQNGTMYITVKCIENEDCAAENVVIRAYKEMGPRTITPTSFFTASGHVNPDTVDWYSICVPDWETGINITTITLSESENIDIFVSRVPYFQKNYTQYVADGIPNWNLWENWQYEFRPFPRCPYSMLMNANVTTGSFSPGMFYVAAYSFCLASCDYCHSAIDYEVQITQSEKDLSRCRAINETTTTTGTTTAAEVSSAVRANNFVYVAYLIFIVLPYILF